MDRIEQCYLRTLLLEYRRLSCPARKRTRAFAVGCEHSSKELFKPLISCYPEHLHELAITSTMQNSKIEIQEMILVLKKGDIFSIHDYVNLNFSVRYSLSRILLSLSDLRPKMKIFIQFFSSWKIYFLKFLPPSTN
jgi:hypothetical protein